MQYVIIIDVCSKLFSNYSFNCLRYERKVGYGTILERVDLSMDWFLGMEITWAYFMWDGKIPAVSER